MKKIIAILLTAILSVSIIGCGVKNTNTQTNEESYNGITRTETTTTTNGKTETEIVYTDENGKVLSAEEGEAAFQAAKEEVENAENATEEEETAAEEEVSYDAALVISNETNSDIVGFTLVTSDEEEWGDNVLGDDVLEAGKAYDLNATLNYAPDTLFDLCFVTSDGEKIEFREVTVGNVDDPENVTIRLAESDTEYSLSIE